MNSSLKRMLIILLRPLAYSSVTTLHGIALYMRLKKSSVGTLTCIHFDSIVRRNAKEHVDASLEHASQSGTPNCFRRLTF